MSVNRVDALTLLSPKRIDILTRYRFMQAMANNTSPAWGLEMYREYIERCNLTSGYVDGHKTSFEHYLSDFSSLFISLRADGFKAEAQPIPIVGGVPINGAHRTAACLALKIEPRVEEVDASSYQQTYSYLESLGYPKDLLNDVSLAYVELKSTTRYLMLTGGDYQEHSRFREELEKLFDVVGVSNITCSPVGQNGLLRVMYSDNEWWEESLIDKFRSLRFVNGDASCAATIIFIDTLEDLVDIKDNLRNLILGHEKFKRRIHGSDNHFQTLLMAQTVLNKNSVHYLNFSNPQIESKVIPKISSLREKSQSPSNSICLVGSTVMELYGIRKARDLDFISDQSVSAKTSWRGVDLDAPEHRDLRPLYTSLTSDPRFFFWLNGTKVMSLDSLIVFKFYRAAEKDKSDLKLIIDFLHLNDSDFNQPLPKSRNFLMSLKRTLYKSAKNCLPRFMRKALASIFHLLRSRAN